MLAFERHFKDYVLLNTYIPLKVLLPPPRGEWGATGLGCLEHFTEQPLPG